MSVIWYTPNGEQISTVRARITAVGVALLFTYVINWLTQGLATYLLLRNATKEERNQSLTKILQITRVLYLFPICVIFSTYPPFFQGLALAIMAWITFVVVLLAHIFCFMDKRIAERSLWAYAYALFHLLIAVWLLLIMGFAYTWMGDQ